MQLQETSIFGLVNEEIFDIAVLFTGDAAFSKVLVDEIKDERLRMANVPEPSDGWTLKQDGTSCTLSKLAENNQ